MKTPPRSVNVLWHMLFVLLIVSLGQDTECCSPPHN